MTDVLERGRESYRRRAWGEAHRALRSVAAQSGGLAPEDLVLLATCAYLTGQDAESQQFWTRAHEEFLHRGDRPRAARAAFWLGLLLALHGEQARGAGWLARADRIVHDLGRDCAESYYLLIPAGLQTLAAGDAGSACDTFGQAVDAGDRFGEPDLRTLGLLGQGQSLVASGETPDAMGRLDEAMVAVEAREVSPVVMGIVYCAVILACRQVFDVRRAQQWTQALSAWCRDQPDLVPYRGECLVHRSQLLQMRGRWREAIAEAQEACARTTDSPGQPALGMAFYQRAELHRLRGETSEAGDFYRQAHGCGHSPYPGLALLRLARGRLEEARGAIARALQEAHDPGTRALLLGPCIEIMLAGGEVTSARTAADELVEIAETLGAPMLTAASAAALGAVLLAEAQPEAAAEELARARAGWDALEMPYESARVRVLLGRTCGLLGDPDGAQLETDAARRTFRQLEARQDLAALEEPSTPRDAEHALTARELDVIRLVAAGHTNRQIAEALTISEKTVARHLSNIFTKLDLSNRTAVAAYAFSRRLL